MQMKMCVTVIEMNLADSKDRKPYGTDGLLNLLVTDYLSFLNSPFIFR